ncbi:hypothetical protein Asppvi_007144 [Aspergillus pseudoviridinutans]|uniref:HNH nuclease domain-containing protein n=1 Tax=Aspergillus pseudoviridinutans TaxID=1517512 RepID=A0A9P3EU60_9EURO|nr:uncharacterized protein Asppvi_007144 [Aspergillus pseudoviridinutans]GIJ88226.1 hypothetical protein Asppvi_007144 [Aspergillus pseudoviridinutans]
MDVDNAPAQLSPARQRSTTVIYNGSPLPADAPSDDREALLLELGQALETQAVPASFWACLQVADLSALRTFVQEARAAPRICELLSDTFYALPRMWRQNPPEDPSSSCSSSSRGSDLSDDVPRSRSPRKIAKERDGGKCVVTGRQRVQACPIFPHCLLKKKKPTDLTRSIPDLWKLLSLFFDNEDVLQWKNAIFPNPDQPTDGIPENLTCLSPNVHGDWADGYCAFKPLRVSSDGREMEYKFHWLPREPHGPTDKVDLSRRPLSTAGLDQSEGRFSYTFEGHRIQSGDTFFLKTSDPVTHPLPSFTLLQMSWKLTQIVALSAAAEDPDPEDDVDKLETYNKEVIDRWMAEPSDDDDNDFFTAGV